MAIGVLLCFTLLPGATAHVEQNGNRLDVLIALPGASTFIIPASGQSTAPSIIRSDIPRFKNSNAASNVRKSNKQTTPPAAAEPRKTGATSVAPKASVTPAQASSTPAIATSSPPQKSATSATGNSSATQRSSTPAAANSSPTPVAPSSPSQDRWSRMKERAHYWILLAQLNPIPVGLGRWIAAADYWSAALPTPTRARNPPCSTGKVNTKHSLSC